MIRNLKFDDRGLLPTTVQDTRSHQILVQDFMNAESLALTVQSGTVWFYSASRNEVWCSRSSFGQVHRVVDIAPDPEGTGLRIQVEVGDPAADESKSPDARRARSLSAVPPTRSGVSDPLKSTLSVPEVGVVDVNALEVGILLEQLYRFIEQRKHLRPEGSYTTYLLNAGLDRILKKIGEEVTETILAAKNGSPKELSAEVADMLFHILVLLVDRGIPLREILLELNQRVGKPAEPK